MGEVTKVVFGKKLDACEPEEYENDSWVSGTFACQHCKHEWVDAVSISIMDAAECPACGLFRGVSKFSPAPAEGRVIYKCICGCETFFITAKDAIGDGQTFKLRTTPASVEEFRTQCAGCGKKGNPFTSLSEEELNDG